MREKILAQLVSKYSGVSKRFLGLLADKIAKKVTEESGIDQAITDFDNAASITDLATDFQKEADLRVNEAKKEFQKNPPKKDVKTDEPDDKDDLPKKDQMPEWAKGLMSEIKTLKAEKVQGSMKSKASDQLKDIPEKFYGKRALPEKEEDLPGFIEEVKKDYTDFQQEQIDKGLMVATPPGGGGGSGGSGDSKAIEADIQSWAKKSTPVEKAPTT